MTTANSTKHGEELARLTPWATHERASRIGYAMSKNGSARSSTDETTASVSTARTVPQCAEARGTAPLGVA
jgi:hypothetical protein